MKQVNFDAQTGETTVEEVPDIEIEMIPEREQTELERIEALESAVLEMILVGAV